MENDWVQQYKCITCSKNAHKLIDRIINNDIELKKVPRIKKIYNLRPSLDRIYRNLVKIMKYFFNQLKEISDKYDYKHLDYDDNNVDGDDNYVDGDDNYVDYDDDNDDNYVDYDDNNEDYDDDNVDYDDNSEDYDDNYDDYDDNYDDYDDNYDDYDDNYDDYDDYYLDDDDDAMNDYLNLICSKCKSECNKKCKNIKILSIYLVKSVYFTKLFDTLISDNYINDLNFLLENNNKLSDAFKDKLIQFRKDEIPCPNDYFWKGPEYYYKKIFRISSILDNLVPIDVYKERNYIYLNDYICGHPKASNGWYRESIDNVIKLGCID